MSVVKERKIALGGRSFAGLLATQALGAFNDNAFKSSIALMAVLIFPPEKASRLIAVAGALFVAPFILFSNLAGALADRKDKRDLIVFFKAAEVVLMALSFVALRGLHVPLLLGLLFLMGVHSAFFSPAKLGILPELLEEKDLSQGNGLVQMTSFLGIILGTAAAGFLVDLHAESLHHLAFPLVGVAVAGLLCSLLVPSSGMEPSKEPVRFNLLVQTFADLREVRASNAVFLAVVGSAYFWFLGAVFQMNILMYGKGLMGAGERTLSVFQLAVAAGIGVGSFMAGRLSRERVELGLVPVGALGLVLFSLDLAFSFRSLPRTVADLALLGLSGGCFALPLQAFIQERSPADKRGKFIAVSNLLAFSGVLLASAWLWADNSVFKLHAGQIFLSTAAMTTAVTVYIVFKLPDFLTRLLLYPIANLIYRIRSEGARNIPLKGPVLLVSNHVSFVDAILIAVAAPRLVRFIMFRTYYELPVLHWFFRAMGCIPISDNDKPKAVLASFKAAQEKLLKGEAVCIFAEGEITRHGQMLRFKKGFEWIVRGIEVPVVPVFLDRIWGSIFSFERGRLLLKRPRRLPYPVTVAFGKPLPSTKPAFEIRQAMLDLGSEVFRHRLEERASLPVSFLQEAKRHPLRLALADSTGARLNYAQALARSYALGRALLGRLPSNDSVGVLLPPSVAAALANVGLAMMGKVPINLNYTASREIALGCAAKAKAGTVLTSRRFLEKLGWEGADNFLYIEDVAKSVSKLRAAVEAAGLWLLPSRLAGRLFLDRARNPLDHLATVIFTSGSTGVPKGVMLTHANILSNIEGMAQLYHVTGEDRILGVLPFFHSFGYTATLWFPLLSGFGAIYHYNPLEAKRIGELAREHRATLLLGTPTFLQNYLRRVEPADFKSLRYVLAGAEKLREELADAFAEKFGLRPLAGYGCTELSPVASVNIPDIDWPGTRQQGTKPGTIGHPLPGVTVKVVDPETGATLPAGTPGLLLVKGPNVMAGYLDDPKKTAEVLRDGYYVTGDIAKMDEDGFITITDRLSRFSKIGGEMVPHIKVEETLHALAGKVEQTYVVTAVPDEKRGERLVVLCKADGDLDELQKKLAASDLPKLWVPAREDFHTVTEFPLLGSGKLDLVRLKALALQWEK